MSLIVLSALAALGLGGWAIRGSDQMLVVVAGLGGVGLLLLGTLVYCQVILLHKVVNSAYRSYDAALDVTDLLRRQSDYTRTMAENSALSDWAKKIVYHEKDHEFLRDTIHGAIIREDWTAAEHLIAQLDSQLGYGEEAELLRADLRKARQATSEEKIAAALQRFDKLCATQKWDQARRETARLQTLFPNDPRIAGLPRDLEKRRQQHKSQLLKEYQQAVGLQDVDRAHRLLFELDRYLAPNEAAALKDSARGVFKAKLQQMGVQFSLAVSDKQFHQAIEIGERLMREFPNSRYSHEIADMMPVLRQRAAE